MKPRLTTTACHGLFSFALAAVLLLACGGEDTDNDGASSDTAPPTTASSTTSPQATVAALPPAHSPELLSEWRQLEVGGGQLRLAERVVPYSLNSALFSDYAHKLRTVWLPEGADPAEYQPEEVFDFPVGTVITKTFYYPLAEGDAPDAERVVKVAQPADSQAQPLDLSAVRLLETRVLVHRAEGWVALPYVWNDDQSEATLQRIGDLKTLTLVDGETETHFPYVVPNSNQCSGCHATNHTTKAILPIGPKARHLNLEIDVGDGVQPQLELWRERGLIGEMPDLAQVPVAAVWDDEAESLGARARAYLDINCAHCHNREGPADTSGLFLESSTELGPRLGVCKVPVAAGSGTGGRLVGIEPGEPDESIFVYRMETSDPGAMMPELGRALTHQEGVELISAWIGSLDGEC